MFKEILFCMLNTFMFVYGHLPVKVLITSLSAQKRVKRSVSRVEYGGCGKVKHELVLRLSLEET